MKKMLFTAALAAALAGCSGCSTTTTQDAQLSVYGLQGTYMVAQGVAKGYTHLPVCPQNAPVCSKDAVTVKIAALDDAAVKALNDAQAAVTSSAPNTAALLALAGAAVADFNSFVLANKVTQ